MTSQALPKPNTSQQHSAYIYLKIGGNSHEIIVVSISKAAPNYLDLGSIKHSQMHSSENVSGNMEGENSNTNALMLSFTKLNENNNFDPSESSLCSSEAQKPSRVSVDLTNETPQAVLITNSNAASRQVSVCCAKQYSLESSQTANKPASHGRYCQNPTYVNVNPGYEST